MERPLWDRIQEIYYSTLPMPQSERSAFIASSCSDDPFLLREVTSLLQADESSAGFLESPVFELGLKIISSDSVKVSGNGSADSLVGTTIDKKYLVERALGHGGMGKVYFARDLTLHNRPVVIKVLLDASVKDDYVVKKFRQEVEALARIDHPGVVSVLSAGELPDGKPFIVMQYVNGVTLRSLIPMEGMDLERAAQILRQIGAALDDIHENGIFHRDLKPENIMIQSLRVGTELVKVVDFGIAKVKDSVVAPSTVDKISVGTVLYMSPEQLRGGERITAASDIYSMGVVAYEMVTGRRPFSPASAPQLLELHREGVRVMPIDLRRSLSTEAQAIILRALSFEPGARYQSAAEFGDSLAKALLNEEETAPRYNTPRQVTNPDYSGQLGGEAGTLQPGLEESQAQPFTSVNNYSEHPIAAADHRLRPGKFHFAVIGGFLIVIFGVVGFLWSIRTGEPGTEPPNVNKPEKVAHTRAFIFWLTIKRRGNERKFENVSKSTDKDVFDTGDKFQFNLTSSNPGYLYVFNEGAPERTKSSFTLIYPTPLTNAGSATLGGDQTAETGWNEFKGRPGTENLWIAWSTTSVPELETAKAEAFNREGVLTGTSLDAVKAFLTAKQDESDPKIIRNKENQQVQVRGTGDVVVKMIKLEHR